MKYLSNLFLFIDESDETKSYKVWASDNEVITTLSKIKDKSKASIIHDLLLMAQKNDFYFEERVEFEETEEFSKLIENFKTAVSDINLLNDLDDKYFFQQNFTRRYLDLLDDTLAELKLDDVWNAKSIVYMFPQKFSVHYNETIQPLLKDIPIEIEPIEWRFILATLWEMQSNKYFRFEMSFDQDIKNLLEQKINEHEQLWFQFITLIVNAFDSEKNYFVSVYDERLDVNFFPIAYLKEFINEKKSDYEELLIQISEIADEVIDEIRSQN